MKAILSMNNWYGAAILAVRSLKPCVITTQMLTWTTIFKLRHLWRRKAATNYIGFSHGF